MKFINKEIIQMLELMNKYPKINRFMWALMILTFTVAMIYLLLNGLPAVLKALADYQRAINH